MHAVLLHGFVWVILGLEASWMEAFCLERSIYRRRKALKIRIHQKLQVSSQRPPKPIFTPDSVLSAQAGIQHIICHVIDINVLQATHLSSQRKVPTMSWPVVSQNLTSSPKYCTHQKAAWHNWMPEKRAAGLSSAIHFKKLKWLFYSGGTLYLCPAIVVELVHPPSSPRSKFHWKGLLKAKN